MARRAVPAGTCRRRRERARPEPWRTHPRDEPDAAPGVPHPSTPPRGGTPRYPTRDADRYALRHLPGPDRPLHPGTGPPRPSFDATLPGEARRLPRRSRAPPLGGMGRRGPGLLRGRRAPGRLPRPRRPPRRRPARAPAPRGVAPDQRGRAPAPGPGRTTPTPTTSTSSARRPSSSSSARRRRRSAVRPSGPGSSRPRRRTRSVPDRPRSPNSRPATICATSSSPVAG